MSKARFKIDPDTGERRRLPDAPYPGEGVGAVLHRGVADIERGVEPVLVAVRVRAGLRSVVGRGCTCSPAGQDPNCPTHGYEAVLASADAAYQHALRLLDDLANSDGSRWREALDDTREFLAENPPVR